MIETSRLFEKLFLAWIVVLALSFCASLGLFMWVLPFALFAQGAAASAIALVLSLLLAFLIGN